MNGIWGSEDSKNLQKSKQILEKQAKYRQIKRQEHTKH